MWSDVVIHKLIKISLLFISGRYRRFKVQNLKKERSYRSPSDTDQSGDNTLKTFGVALEDTREGIEMTSISDTGDGVEEPSVIVHY